VNDEEYADCMTQYRIMRADGLAVELYDGAGRDCTSPTTADSSPSHACGAWQMRQ
jgi:hypothetical protein